MATPLYYASFADLQRTVRVLLKASADVNAQGGDYGNTLQADSSGGNLEAVPCPDTRPRSDQTLTTVWAQK